jgi:predicted AlkP superfamily phosphohydrolase/phosphomutase
MVKTLKQRLVRVRNFLTFKKYDFLTKINKTTFRVNLEANFVVSIASYPKRDPLLPAVYEALKRQTSLPKKWLLVLSEEE